MHVPQHRQRGLGRAVEGTQKEILLLKSRGEELHMKNLRMGKIMDGFEEVVSQMMEEVQKQKEFAKTKIQKILKEKDQLTTDPNPMKKSFSDLFKQFEKQKEATEGYCKNEESLKKRIEDYMLRTEEERQRCPVLKTHSEKKLKQSSSRGSSRCPTLPPGFVQRLAQPSARVRALRLAARKRSQTRERGLPILQAEGQKDGGQAGGAQTTSLEEAPAPTCRRTPKADLAPGRGGAAEPALTRRGAILAAKALAGRRACRRLDRTVAAVVQFLQVEDRKKSPVTRSELGKYALDSKDLFPEIIARAAEHLRYVFNFELKLGRKHHTYLVNKLKPLGEEEEDLRGDGLRLGLLMILGFIYMKGNSTREAQVGEMLHRGVFGGGCPSKYADNITTSGHPKRHEDFVQQQYLNYRRVPHTIPPDCEFSWGPSNLETSKLKILGFVAKLRSKEPQHPVQPEVLAEEVDKARAEASIRLGAGPMLGLASAPGGQQGGG
ncbi:LOW QUALITY PROTEIN: melanoma-associated antigen F1 [Molossus nigricans]